MNPFQLLSRVEALIDTTIPDASRRRLLLGVSGGIDSMALLDLFARVRERLGLHLGILHVNYGVRGLESSEDARFVKFVARSYKIPIHAFSLPPAEIDRLKESNFQEGARRVRLQLFKNLKAKEGYRYLVMAHHQNDQVETFLFNLFRGAGPGGLEAMKTLSSRGIFRPLLGVDRSTLHEYMKARSLPHRRDRTNDQAVYTRNRIRHEVIPQVIKSVGRDPRSAISRAAELISCDNDLLEVLAKRETTIIFSNPGGINGERLLKLPPALRRRVSRDILSKLGWGDSPAYHPVEALLNWMRTSSTGEVFETRDGRFILRDFDCFKVVDSCYRDPEVKSMLLAIDHPVRLAWADTVIKARFLFTAQNTHRPPHEFLADLDRVDLPLMVGQVHPSDYIRPLGMDGHRKKVVKILNDRHCPHSDRRKVVVVRDQREIIWVVGHVVSHATRVTQETKEFLHLDVVPMGRANP